MKDGEVSNVVTTDYGNHIIKRLFRIEIDPVKERDEVRKIYKKQYFDADKAAFLDKTAAKLNFKINNENFSALVSSLDSSKNNISKNWADSVPANLLSKNLFSISAKDYSIKDFVTEMSSNSQLKGFATNKEGMTRAIKKIIEPTVIDFATSDLENKYPDFKQLLAEFNDGILLFKVETLEVWEKLSFDSVAAKKYYEANT